MNSVTLVVSDALTPRNSRAKPAMGARRTSHRPVASTASARIRPPAASG